MSTMLALLLSVLVSFMQNLIAEWTFGRGSNQVRNESKLACDRAKQPIIQPDAQW